MSVGFLFMLPHHEKKNIATMHIDKDVLSSQILVTCKNQLNSILDIVLK